MFSFSKAFLALFSISLSFVVLECGLRVISVHSQDGAISVLGIPCPPFEAPLKDLERAISQHHRDRLAALQYDAILGWSPRPNSSSKDDLYHFDQFGTRVASQQQTTDNNLRTIGLFGDSTMQGTGVQYYDSIGAKLPQNFAVKNFAVGGYGIDQAYLRWKEVSKSNSFETVILGFQAENVKRGGNIFRPFYTYTSVDLPFSKPRFILDGGELVVINQPTLPVEEVELTLSNFQNSELSRYEYFYEPFWYSDSVLFRSRLLAFVLSAAVKNNKYSVEINERAVYQLRGELGSLALATLKRFRDEVEQSGSKFFIVHLPRQITLERLGRGEGLFYQELWREIENEFLTIDTTEAFLGEIGRVGISGLFVDPWHYSGNGAAIIAREIARKLEEGS